MMRASEPSDAGERQDLRVNRPEKAPGIVPGIWWALVRGPKELPVLFESYQDACENQDEDEYIVKVRVTRSLPKHRRPR
jgi:hypothetical protein